MKNLALATLLFITGNAFVTPAARTTTHGFKVCSAAKSEGQEGSDELAKPNAGEERPRTVISPRRSPLSGGLAPTRFFDEIFGGLEDSFGLSRAFPSMGHLMRQGILPTGHLDISETDRNWIVRVDLPGVKKEDISLNIEDGILSVSAQRKQEEEQGDEKLHRVERVFGLVQRSVVLPEGADEENVSAEFKDGVLQVKVAKGAQPKPKGKTIEVQ